MTLRCVLSTNNPDKAAEIQMIFEGHGGVELLDRPAEVGEIEETGETLLDNARLKALALSESTGQAAIADDTGLEVDALGGDPGVYSARYAGEGATDADNNRRLLAALRDVTGPLGARYRCVIAFVRHADDPHPLLAQGTWHGRITRTPRGEAGFGYDPLFVVADDPRQRTAAELDAAHKNRVSHRAQALAQLRTALLARTADS